MMTTDFISIPSRNFYGECSRSPSGRYTLAWRDGNDSGDTAGSRNSGLGRYVLLDGRAIVAEGAMERPNDGKVADTGVFILNDWRFGEGLKGTFSAFDREGHMILDRAFTANLFNNGLSRDGRFAVCQTCHSPGSPDSSVLTIFDLTVGREAGKFAPESGWAEFYEFPDEHAVGLGYRELGVFRYTHDGMFVDRADWQQAKLTKGPPTGALWLVDRLIKEAGGRVSTALSRTLIDAVDRALAEQIDDRMRALALKCRGLCLDSQGASAEALTCYESALALDPKIGLKRRAGQLAKALARTA